MLTKALSVMYTILEKKPDAFDFLDSFSGTYYTEEDMRHWEEEQMAKSKRREEEKVKQSEGT